jgi:serine/threonine protein kinase
LIFNKTYHQNFYDLNTKLVSTLIKLYCVFVGSDLRNKRSSRPLHLVFEMMDFDLSALRESLRSHINTSFVKHYTKQLLEAVAFLHSQNIVHRDIKGFILFLCLFIDIIFNYGVLGTGANILISRQHVLKLADFGLSRMIQRDKRAHYTGLIQTLWYRAPEVLLGDSAYTFAVDNWSVGCLFYELLTDQALFPCNSELEQIGRIFKVCGSPSAADWPEFSKLPTAKSLSMREVLPFFHSTLHLFDHFITLIVSLVF